MRQHKVVGMSHILRGATLYSVVVILLWFAPMAHATPPTMPLPSRPAPDCNTERCIALTFDDGPGYYTPKLLDILRDHQIKATFFLIGAKVPGDERVVRRMMRDGHEVGNHSFSHYEMTYLSPLDTYLEWWRAGTMIHNVTGYYPTIARPPYGAANNTTYEQMGRLGMSSILWSVDPRDWADKDSETVCQRIIHDTHPGAIILLHDIHSTSVDAVPCVIENLSAQDYQFVTVTELLGETQPGHAYRLRK